MKISERIKEYRKFNNLTQKEFAQKLFVSKQAVSKWENELGLPDVSLYPVLAEMFCVSVDELMGVKTKENNRKKHIIYIFIICIILLISLITTAVIVNKNKTKELESLITQTEQNLGINLPDVHVYEYVDTTDLAYHNSWYPQCTYYFIFEENIKLNFFENNIITKSDWINEVSNEIKNILPYNAKPYCDTCQYFKLIDKQKNKVINGIPNNNGIYSLALYCYQEELNRLIVISFEYEVGNEKNS